MINLLPPQYKEELKQEENWRLVLLLGILILVFLISIILILFAIKFHIGGRVESEKTLVNLEEKYSQTSEIKELRQKIILANQNLSKLNSFYSFQVSPSEILEKVSKTIPSGIYLTAFSWQKNTSQISLAGFSPERKILFEFKENLEKEKEFTEIYFPPSSWINPVDINFYITFKIK